MTAPTDWPDRPGPDTEASIPLPQPVTAAQRARYTRMLVTTLAILDESGPAGVQVREVARRSDVALATLYRYFPSRDVLIAMALDHWSTGLAARLAARRAARTADRSAPGTLTVRGELADALQSVAEAFADHGVARALATYQTSFAAGLGAVLDGIPEPQRGDVLFVIESVLTAQLVGFSSGRSTQQQMEAALRRAVRIIDLGAVG